MTNDDSTPVHVTGEERRHPAIRKLARGCIELARLRLQDTVLPPAEEAAGRTTTASALEPEQEGDHA